MCPHLSSAAQQVQGLWESDALRVGEYAVLCEGFVAAAAAGGDAALQSQASPWRHLYLLSCARALLHRGRCCGRRRSPAIPDKRPASLCSCRARKAVLHCPQAATSEPQLKLHHNGLQ